MDRVHVPPDRIMGHTYLAVAHALLRSRHGRPPSANQETADAHKARPPPATRKSG